MSSLTIEEAAERETTFALMYRAATPDDDEYSKLDDPESAISKLARGRGGAKYHSEGPPTETPEANEGGGDGTSHYKQKRYTMEMAEGRLKAPEGYMMRFIDHECSRFTLYDNLTINEDNKSYPVKKSTLENLPTEIVKSLYANGDVKLRGNYDQDRSQFIRASLGWERTTNFEPMKRIMEIVELTGSTAPAIDYVYVVEGPDEWDAERVAEMRGIGAKSVENNIHSVEKALGNE